jgi:hypothetical protein
MKNKNKKLRKAAKLALDWFEQYMNEAEGSREMENAVAGDEREGIVGVAEIDTARDWVKTVLKTIPSRKRSKSVFDLPPLDLGRVLYSGGVRDDLLEEMLDDTRF